MLVPVRETGLLATALRIEHVLPDAFGLLVEQLGFHASNIEARADNCFVRGIEPAHRLKEAITRILQNSAGILGLKFRQQVPAVAHDGNNGTIKLHASREGFKSVGTPAAR